MFIMNYFYTVDMILILSFYCFCTIKWNPTFDYTRFFIIIYYSLYLSTCFTKFSIISSQQSKTRLSTHLRVVTRPHRCRTLCNMANSNESVIYTFYCCRNNQNGFHAIRRFLSRDLFKQNKPDHKSMRSRN